MTIDKTIKPGDWNPQTWALARELDGLYPTVSFGTYPGHHPTTQRANDGMIPGYLSASGISLGTNLAEHLWLHRRRYNLWYEIWRARIRSMTHPGQGWTTYTPAASAAAKNPDSAYHRNHVHLSTYPQTNVPYGTVWIDRLDAGVTDSESVRIIQRALGVPVTGSYDPATVAAAKTFQAQQGNAPQYCDGYLGKWDTVALLTAKNVWATIRTDPSGTEPPVTPPVVTEYPAPTSGKLYLDKVAAGVTGSDTVAYIQMWLAQVLGIVLPRTGTYDPATVAASVRYQRDVLGDLPQYCDGILGRKQLVSLATTVKATVTIFESSVTGGQLWPEPVIVPPAAAKVTIKVADLNILRRTDPEAGKTRLTFTQRLPGLHAVLKAADPDLVFLQEVDADTVKQVFGGLSGFTWHRERGIAIGWRKTVLAQNGAVRSQLYSDKDNRYVLSVPFKHGSGQTFSAAVTHLENDGDPNTDGHAARRLQTSEFCAHTKTGRWIMGADLNSTTQVLGEPTPRQKEKPRLILAANGWTMLSQTRMKLPDGKLESHWGGRASNKIVEGPWIDDLGVKGGPRLVTGRLRRTDPTRCSDHHLIEGEVEL